MPTLLYRIQTHRRRAIVGMILGDIVKCENGVFVAERLLATMAPDETLPSLCREAAKEAREAFTAALGKLPWRICIAKDAGRNYFVKVTLHGNYFCHYGHANSHERAIEKAIAAWDGIIIALNRAGITSAPANLKSTAE